jgi:hypothetical protein
MILQNNAQRTPRYDHPICWRLGDLAALDPKADVDFKGSFSADPRLSDALLLYLLFVFFGFLILVFLVTRILFRLVGFQFL